MGLYKKKIKSDPEPYQTLEGTQIPQKTTGINDLISVPRVRLHQFRNRSPAPGYGFEPTTPRADLFGKDENFEQIKCIALSKN